MAKKAQPVAKRAVKAMQAVLPFGLGGLSALPGQVRLSAREQQNRPPAPAKKRGKR